MLLQIAVLPLLASAAVAEERPIPAERLLLRDASHQDGAKVRFSAEGVTALAPGALDDPRATGATLEIAGNGAGDGATGLIPLAPANWTALGPPNAPTGYEYDDPARAFGIRRVVVRTGAPGGSVLIVGGGSAWPFVIAQPQGAIDVRLTVGNDVYCARLTNLTPNVVGRLVARSATAPGQCAARAPRCGNHVVEDGEGCDDGATAGDGCSPSCQLTDRTALCAGTGTAFGDGIRAELVTDELDTPTYLTAPPLDTRRLFVTEQDGRIRIVKDGVLLNDPFLAIEDDVLCCGERGLLSVAFHPDYVTNRRFFVYYNDNRGQLVIARYLASADPDRADPDSRRIVLRIPHPGHGNHNGGQLAFGPDGYLYAGPGDGGGSDDPDENAQDPTSLLGKLLRIDVDVDGSPYRAVPEDNPSAGAGAKLGLIWATGVRNPWRFSFDRANGDLYVADVGQNDFEEIDVVAGTSPGGENYGWDIFEASSCNEPTPPASLCPDRSTFVFPVLEYDHGDGCSISGGYVYRGCALPDLHGTYFYSDFCSSFVRTFRGVSGGVAQSQDDRTAELSPEGGRALNNIVSFGEDARGEIYVVDRDGELYRIVPDGR